MIVADSNLVTDGLVPRPLRVPGRNLMTVPISLSPRPKISGAARLPVQFEKRTVNGPLTARL